MNNNIGKYTFWDLICKYAIQIPIIQRDYVQGREFDKVTEIRNNFLESLYDALKTGKHLDLNFIYGSLKGDELFIPLDGQQRLTTLFLLHWYLAVKDKKITSIKQTLKKFTYEIRTSSREFCNALVENSDIFEEIDFKSLNSVSHELEDAPWFFLSWKKDPTIKSMLVMLDAIHDKFKDTCSLFDILIDTDKCPITFQFIQLENFGLDDSLYIKMNARGKTLTDFENFKAKFLQLLQQKENNNELNKGFTKEFSIKIDGDWTDLFWNYRSQSNNLFDQQIMNFFKAMIINNYALKTNISLIELEKRLNYFISKKHISFAKYSEWESFDKNVITDIYFTLEALKNNSGEKIRTYLPDNSLMNEEELFKKVIKNYMTYTDRVQFYALCQYFKENKLKIDGMKFVQWIRVIRNLSENTLYNDAGDFARSIKSIARLIKNCNDILDFLCDENNEVSGFLKEQVEEERVKAILILKNDRWKNAIIEAENHGYFRGQIGFILKFAGIMEAYYKDKKLNWTQNVDDEYFCKFNNYFNKAKAIFDNSGLKVNNDLWRRALLCKGDYLLKSGRNLSFLIDKHRDISWKRLLRDNNIKRDYVKELLDDIDIQKIDYSLQKVIDNSNVSDWRKYFIKYPNLIEKGCGEKKFIRMNSHNDVLLLNSSTTAGYCREYYTYALYFELKKNNKMLQYVEERGVDGDRHIKFTKYDITIRYKSVNGKWSYEVEEGQNKKYFDTQDDVLDYLRNQQYIN